MTQPPEFHIVPLILHQIWLQDLILQSGVEPLADYLVYVYLHYAITSVWRRPHYVHNPSIASDGY